MSITYTDPLLFLLSVRKSEEWWWLSAYLLDKSIIVIFTDSNGQNDIEPGACWEAGSTVAQTGLEGTTVMLCMRQMPSKEITDLEREERQAFSCRKFSTDKYSLVPSLSLSWGASLQKMVFCISLGRSYLKEVHLSQCLFPCHITFDLHVKCQFSCYFNQCTYNEVTVCTEVAVSFHSSGFWFHLSMFTC